MKSRALFLVTLVVILFVSFGCSRDGSANPSAQIALEPDAKPVHDSAYTGIYKGVLTTKDGSGKLELDIGNENDGEITLSGSYNGSPFKLAGNETYLPESKEYEYAFEGETADDEYRITFRTEISLLGDIDTANTRFTADGEEVHVNIAKETSGTLVEVYEGSYSGESTGTWNFVVKEGSISGYYAEDGKGEFTGTYVPVDGRIRVWGSGGSMLASGQIDRNGNARGVWLFQEGAGYTADTPVSEYPAVENGNDNSWSGSRTL